MLTEFTEQLFNVKNAADWLMETPGEPDQVLLDTFDAGDKIAIIGSSKMRKSFFLLQMITCVAAGRPFLCWDVPKPRRILHVQLEIQEHHFHQRVRRMAGALGVGPEDLDDRFKILNARGLGLSGQKGIDTIRQLAEGFRPEIITIDPLYKLAQGAENAAEDLKVILSAFDSLSLSTNAAIAYVHHDAKGFSGDRDIRDRGAGSNVLGRDYDACLTLTPHATDDDAAVVEVLLRNYRPQDAFSIRWTETEAGGYCFDQAPDLLAEKKTSKTRAQAPSLETYRQAAEDILSDGEMDVNIFKRVFKARTGLSDNRIKEFLRWATDPDATVFITREARGRGHYQKWLRCLSDEVN